MPQMHKSRPKRQRNKFRTPKTSPRTQDQVWIDFEKLPADLDEEQLRATLRETYQAGGRA